MKQSNFLAEDEQQQRSERYQLRQKLGQGTFGTVWKALDRHSGLPVAVKQMSKADLNAWGGKPCFNLAREPVMMRACVHENIARILASYEDDQSIYLAMECCEGGDLGSVALGSRPSVPKGQLTEWFRDMCSAVAALHEKRICHRDLKPSNFLLTRESLVKLSDFGLAVFVPEGKVLKQRCGTIPFMSPEIYRLPRSRGYSFSADAWAMGLCIYMLGMRQHPFHSKNLLDELALLNGRLAFPSYLGSLVKHIQGGIGGVAPEEESLSDCPDFRQLCQGLVHADEKQRLSAAGALRTSALLASSAPGRLRPPQTRLCPSQVAPHPGPPTVLISHEPGSRDSAAGTVQTVYSPRDVLAYPRLKLGQKPAHATPSGKTSITEGTTAVRQCNLLQKQRSAASPGVRVRPVEPGCEKQEQDVMSWFWQQLNLEGSSLIAPN